MQTLFGIGLIVAGTIMILWPLMDDWFKDLEQGDENWIEKW